MTVSAPSTNSTGVASGGLEIWQTATGNRVGQCLLFTNSITTASLSQNGKRLLLLDDYAAQVWDFTAGKPLAQRIWQAEDAEAVMINSSIGGATNRSSATLASLHPTAQLQYFRFGAFNPTGTAVATWQAAVVRVWDAVSGRELFPRIKHPFPVKHVEFSPDGSKLLTCGADGGLNRCEARVWNALTGEPMSPPLKHMDGVLWAAFSPNGLRVATASEDFTASLWEIATGRALARGLKHEDQAASAAFSPDGRWLLTVAGDRTVRVWSADTGDPIAPPQHWAVGAADARFLADNRHIVAFDYAGNVRQWTLTRDDWPISDLGAFASVLTGETLGIADRPASSSSESLHAAWQQLRAKYPSAFTVSPSEVRAWHSFQAELSEGRRQWFAAAFHLNQLISSSPPDPSLLERLDRAQKHLSAP
jgi:WD40 repeat protein